MWRLFTLPFAIMDYALTAHNRPWTTQDQNVYFGQPYPKDKEWLRPTKFDPDWDDEQKS